MSGLIPARLGRRGRRLALVGCSTLAAALAATTLAAAPASANDTKQWCNKIYDGASAQVCIGVTDIGSLHGAMYTGTYSGDTQVELRYGPDNDSLSSVWTEKKHQPDTWIDTWNDTQDWKVACVYAYASTPGWEGNGFRPAMLETGKSCIERK
jgi:hypothetical protein